MDEVSLNAVFESVERFKSETRFGNGWIMKAPYVQNSQGFRLRHANVPYATVFEYLIVQPKFDKAESKIILYNGKAQYIVSTSGKGLLGKFSAQKLLMPQKTHGII
eukprot:gene35695-46303_t